MQAIQCSKGHFYDQSLGQCPQCAEEARKNNAAYDLGKTDFIPKTAPAVASAGDFNSLGGFYSDTNVSETVDVTSGGFSKTDFVSQGGGTSWQVDDYGETQISGMNGVSGFDPIVGWLVCVSGPNRGRDYRLHSGTNFIGSSKEMDICIENDNTISRRKAASVSYDDIGKVFFIQKGEGRNLIYLNGAAVRSDADLAIYDRIRIGSTELIFVPLCCDKFTWQEV